MTWTSYLDLQIAQVHTEGGRYINDDFQLNMTLFIGFFNFKKIQLS